MKDAVFVHLGSGIGNIVLATPLLIALDELGLSVDVWLSADYGETADLLRDWTVVRAVTNGQGLDRPALSPVGSGSYVAVIPALPPFYWRRFASFYDGRAHVVARPPDALFYQDEQEYYLSFARSLGFAGPPPFCTLPIGPTDRFEVGGSTVVLAPGCKTGEMAAKRWPWFPDLADRFDDVAVVGTDHDLRGFDNGETRFGTHVRSFVGSLALRDTAELLASAGVVVANDSGLAHVAAAVGTPTLMIFGPTPHATLGRFAPSVKVTRTGLPCEPCWFGGARFKACNRRIDCLRLQSVDEIESTVRAWQGRLDIPEAHV